jgi:RHS repeat-associated protein
MIEQPETLQPKYQYVWSARYVDAPILRDANTNTDWQCDDQRLYYLGDANMNVTALVAQVEGQWQVVERYVYDAYGSAAVYNGAWGSQATEYGNTYRYTGREYDAATGFSYYRTRWYSDGEFLSRDPLGFAAGDQNLYRYVASNPANFVDPSGMDASGGSGGGSGETWQPCKPAWGSAPPPVGKGNGPRTDVIFLGPLMTYSADLGMPSWDQLASVMLFQPNPQIADAYMRRDLSGFIALPTKPSHSSVRRATAPHRTQPRAFGFCNGDKAQVESLKRLLQITKSIRVSKWSSADREAANNVGGFCHLWSGRAMAAILGAGEGGQARLLAQRAPLIALVEAHPGSCEFRHYRHSAYNGGRA